MGHHLYCLAQIVSFALSLYDMLQKAAVQTSTTDFIFILLLHVAMHVAKSHLVDFACGEVVLSGEADVKETFIVAQI